VGWDNNEGSKEGTRQPNQGGCSRGRRSTKGRRFFLGCVRVEHLPSALPDSTKLSDTANRIRKTRYTWRPPQDLIEARELPAGFSLSFDCFISKNNMRQFAPSLDVNAFILHASLAGGAFLTRRPNVSKHEQFSYHAMRLIYQQAPGLREHLDRSFKCEQDLHVPKAGRIDQDVAHILPAGLGLDAKGNGVPWKPGDLIEHGQSEAAERGLVKADQATVIRLGLLAAARQNPFRLIKIAQAESLSLVRLALFDLGAALDPLAPAHSEMFQERLLTALERHVDKGTEGFDKWFFRQGDNLIHQIAKRKSGGQPQARETMRQAQLELIFRSFTYVGDCVCRLMAAFSKALPKPLSAAERSLFDTMYFPNPYIGGLPLILLHARFDFLQEAIKDIWERPSDRKRSGVLLRMLQYYGDMVSRKREADRRYKKQSLHRNKQGRSAEVHSLDERDAATTESKPGLFQEIAEALRQRSEASCRCGTTDYWHAQLDESKTTKELIVYDESCENCPYHERREVKQEKFERTGRAILREKLKQSTRR